MKNPTRIAPPKYRVGRYVLNEYEVRQLQLEVMEGKREGNISVCCMTTNNWYRILPDGLFTSTPAGFGLISSIVTKQIKIIRNGGEKAKG